VLFILFIRLLKSLFILLLSDMSALVCVYMYGITFTVDLHKSLMVSNRLKIKFLYYESYFLIKCNH